MSKLYKRYLELKKQDSSKIYIFKCGIFYIFLDKDAQKMSDILDLKITKLNETVVKCGFPVTTLNKYLSLIQSFGYDISFVETLKDEPICSKNYLLNSDIKELIKTLSLVDYNMLSITEAYDFIKKITGKAKEIEKEINR